MLDIWSGEIAGLSLFWVQDLYHFRRCWRGQIETVFTRGRVRIFCLCCKSTRIIAVPKPRRRGSSSTAIDTTRATKAERYEQKLQ